MVFVEGTTEKELVHTQLQMELEARLEVAREPQEVQTAISLQQGKATSDRIKRRLKAASIAADRAVLAEMASRDEPGRSLRRMERWNDLLPTAGLRKQTKKMISDQQAHIQELEMQGRIRSARWQVACTWGTWFWYVLKRPITELSKSLQGKVGK